ncbi:GNAT family N-acetyltransferase [Heyndrickxia sp. NPDC080065]|uniref:GNAT family N-acetyltransferase n=1 Tax=Heyndrickxia sp. NPDC080065 TaxID=3390568 RepID=UPI003D037E18
MKNIQIRLATDKEGSCIIDLLKETALWIKNKGIDQWTYLLDGGEDEEIIQCIVNKETYVVINDEEIMATFTLYLDQNDWDKHIWGEVPPDSIYLHRLAVKPKYMKNGISKEIFNWINNNIQTDKKYLKLDCVCGNEKLNQFYQNSGFEFLGVSNEHSKYQKLL